MEAVYRGVGDLQYKYLLFSALKAILKVN
jgi:hypothetical protein